MRAEQVCLAARWRRPRGAPKYTESGEATSRKSLKTEGFDKNALTTPLNILTTHIPQQKTSRIDGIGQIRFNRHRFILYCTGDQFARQRCPDTGCARQWVVVEIDARANHQLLIRQGNGISVADYGPRERRSDKNLPLADAIERERELLSELATLGQHIDTSALNAHTLRAWVNQWVAHERAGLALMFESFAFKRGVPLDADFVFDARALPNPYYDAALRGLTGLDAPVADFLGAAPEAHALIGDIEAFLRKWLPRFQEDNRSYLTVAIGCTGGQHRSVYLAEVLGARLANQYPVLVRHRELAPVHDLTG